MSDGNVPENEKTTICTENNSETEQSEMKNDTSDLKCDLKDATETGETLKSNENVQSDISEFEKIQNENDKLRTKLKSVLQDLQMSTEEKENYKNKVQVLETEVNDLKNQQPNNLSPAQQNVVHKMKKQSEEILTKAKGVIFDKTKLIKHQELQIETLTLQVASLKEVLDITKELLNIRNLEVKELEEKMDVLDQKMSVERMRHDIMNKKMDAVQQMNADLKAEYQIQLQLFNQLRDNYSRREELRDFQQENAS